jgi:hypothetical protein
MYRELSNLNNAFGALITNNFVYYRCAMLLGTYTVSWPITVAARSKARTVFGRWDRGSESHLRHECLCALLFCVCVVLFVGRGLATG